MEPLPTEPDPRLRGDDVPAPEPETGAISMSIAVGIMLFAFAFGGTILVHALWQTAVFAWNHS